MFIKGVKCQLFQFHFRVPDKHVTPFIFLHPFSAHFPFLHKFSAIVLVFKKTHSLIWVWAFFILISSCSQSLSSFPDQHHRAGSWGPRSGGSGAAMHGQPKLAGHPLQLLHRAAHAQHQSLSEEEKDMKARRFSKKKKWKKTQNNWKMDPTVQPPLPSSNL